MLGLCLDKGIHQLSALKVMKNQKFSKMPEKWSLSLE